MALWKPYWRSEGYLRSFGVIRRLSYVDFLAFPLVISWLLSFGAQILGHVVAESTVVTKGEYEVQMFVAGVFCV